MDIPPFTMATLLSRAVAEEASMECTIDMLKPADPKTDMVPADSDEPPRLKFDPEHPSLAAAMANGVEDATLAKCLQRGYVDSMVKIVFQGEAAVPALQSTCSKILREWPALQDAGLPLILDYAVKEVITITKFMNVLVSTEVVENELPIVSSVADATTGSKCVVKQVVAGWNP